MHEIKPVGISRLYVTSDGRHFSSKRLALEHEAAEGRLALAKEVLRDRFGKKDSNSALARFFTLIDKYDRAEAVEGFRMALEVMTADVTGELLEDTVDDGDRPND